MRSPGATVRKRLVLLMGGFFLLFLCVCARLVDVQIVRQKELTARGVKQWTRSGVVAARRGDIVDTNGRLLAQSVTSFILTARPRDVKDAGALAKVLARELGLDEETILKKLSGSKAASVTLARQLSREDADRLRAIRQNGNSPDAEALIGITFDEDASRWYPMGTLLAQTLGLCNVDGEGQSGLELQYNDVLAGKPGKMITEVDARARTLPDGVTLYVPAEQGNTLRLTIDRDVQAAVERAVRECAQVNDAVSVQAIAMDVNTGALLAMAMYPTYDPANPPRDDLDRLNELMRLTVLSDVYEPGSTFKMLTVLEYMKENPNTWQDYVYNCNGSYQNGDYTIKCYHGTAHGAQNLIQAFANSCNGAFAEIGMQINSEKFRALANQMLFNSELPYTLPYNQSTFSLDGSSDDWEKLQTAIGQGKTQITPLHNLMIVSAIANGGTLMKPYMIDHVENVGGQTVKKFLPSAYGTLMSANDAQFLTHLMSQVVEIGTGSAMRGASYTVAGKTGSAEFEAGKETHSWFVGFAPADKPKVAICVLAEESGSGGAVAAPIARQVLDRYFAKYGQ